jgi:hypothetical protein
LTLQKNKPQLMNEKMRNPDRDEEHARRRETGGEEEQGSSDNPDGQEVARRLYSTPYETEPTPEEDGATEPQ